jgi:archaeal type IV pilus assembly protein PilA
MESSVSTVILLAVTITVAVSVAFWMGAINSTYAQFEKIEISGVSCSMITGMTRYYWEIEISCKNTGSKTSTFDGIYLNNEVVNIIDSVPPIGGVCTDLSVDERSLESGESISFSIFVDGTASSFSSGTTVKIQIHSASGLEYEKLVSLV